MSTTVNAEVDNTYVYITLFLLYLGLFVVIFRRLKHTPDPPQQYYHPLYQWYAKKETNISDWFNWYYFDSKRRDNLFPTYQNI